MPFRFGYLGPRGTFSEEAAQAYLGDKDDCLWVPFPSIPELLAAVARSEIDEGIVPVENSIEGSVVVTLDILVHEVELQITGEAVLPVRHALLARDGVGLEEVEAVFSHPQALAQCRRTLARLLPGIPQRATNSTADAAREVARSIRPHAALATLRAAAFYGLKALAEDVQDENENATRFLAVGQSRPAPTGSDKTSIVFSFPSDKPGTLYRALGIFAEADINLTKLESRPARRSLGDYIFLVDMEGHVEDEPVRAALDELRQMCGLFKFLGSYPRAAYPRPNAAGGAGRAEPEPLQTERPRPQVEKARP